MSQRRSWYRTPWVFAACGVGLLLVWFVLRWVTNLDESDAGQNAAEPMRRSDLFWAGPSDILFWAAMILIAIAVLVRIWRLVRRIRG